MVTSCRRLKYSSLTAPTDIDIILTWFSQIWLTAIDDARVQSMISLMSIIIGVAVGLPGAVEGVAMSAVVVAASCAMMRVQSSNAVRIPGLPISDRTVDGHSLLRGSR